MSSNNICTRVTDTFVSFYDWVFSCRRVAFTFKQSQLTKEVQEKIEKVFSEIRMKQIKPLTETYKSKIHECTESCKNSSDFEFNTSTLLSSYRTDCLIAEFSSGKSQGAVWGSLASKEENNKIGQICAKDPSVQYVSLTNVSRETALMLSKNESITYLSLSRSLDLDDTAAQELAKSTTLTYLNLGMTGVTNKGLKAFMNNTSLVALVLPWAPEPDLVRFFDQRLLKKLDNRIKQNIQTNTWKMIASLIAFQRANQDHPFKDSILSLLSKGGDLRKMIQVY